MHNLGRSDNTDHELFAFKNACHCNSHCYNVSIFHRLENYQRRRKAGPADGLGGMAEMTQLEAKVLSRMTIITIRGKVSTLISTKSQPDLLWGFAACYHISATCFSCELHNTFVKSMITPEIFDL